MSKEIVLIFVILITSTVLNFFQQCTIREYVIYNNELTDSVNSFQEKMEDLNLENQIVKAESKVLTDLNIVQRNQIIKQDKDITEWENLFIKFMPEVIAVPGYSYCERDCCKEGLKKEIFKND